MKKYSFLLALTILIVFCSCKKTVGPKEPPIEEVPHIEEPQQGKLTNLGTQVAESSTQSGVFLTTDKGIEMLYTVVRGNETNSARLLGYNVADHQLMVNLPLRNILGSWGMAVSSDGILFIGGAESGRLLKHTPGTQLVDDLGKALPSQSFVWELVAGENGEIFGSTSPGCRVFRYHPSEGFSDVGNGPLVAGQSYVRDITYSPMTGKIYAGIGSSGAYLIELDPETGSKKQLLPSNYEGKPGFVFPVMVVPGVSGGDRLFATVAGKTLIYNLSNTNQVEKEITAGISSLSYLKSKDDDKVYHSFSNTDLQVMDFTNLSAGSKKVTNSNKALDLTWNKANDLLVFNDDNEIVKYNPTTKQSSTVMLEVPPMPIQIRVTALGPDGRIWTSGYLTGGNAAYDPETGEVDRYPGLSQAESITIDGDDIYFGNYTKCVINVFDTKKPWNLEEGNPRRIGNIPGQDRPFGGVSVPDFGKVFFGSVPDYGLLGGALFAYNKNTEKLENYGEVMPDLSIISLTYKDGIVYGGTSIYGGAGIDPASSEVKLFAWDILGSKKLYDVVPVPGAKQITKLIIGPDGNIWGVADGTLFIFDTSQKKIVSTHKLVKTYRSKAWKNVEILLHPNGKVYGAGSNEVFSVDPKTKEVTSIFQMEDPSWISMDKKGQLYFATESDLWQYIP